MGERLTRSPPRELVLAHRYPELIDHLDGVAAQLLKRELEMFCPEAQSRLPGEVAVVADKVHLGVVEQRVSFRFAEPTVSQRSSTMPTFA